ncbi:MAG: DUF4199 family protein [Bacteroidetes bacterium]|nr:DUF4199 family protein [Bacteroidota bacterium]
MNDFSAAQKPSKLMPVLIGGSAMTVISIVPVLNWINCACCAGVMGAAVLGVWFYKKSFPPDMPFTIGDGAAIGALSGVIGGIFTSILQFLILGFGSSDFTFQLEDQLDEAFSEAQMQATDPAAVEAARELIMQLAANPMVLFLIGLLFALVIYVGFGALGGVIGGNIFKTRIVPPPPQPPVAN